MAFHAPLETRGPITNKVIPNVYLFMFFFLTVQTFAAFTH